MAFKSMVGASLLMAACVALSGCQNTSPRPSPTPSGFTQRPVGSANPPVVAGPATAQPNGLTPNYTPAPGGVSGVPTASPAITGSQSRLTAQPFIPNSGPGQAFNPNAGVGPTSFTTNPASVPGTSFNPSNLPPPSFGANSNGPGLESPILPPANPSFGGVPAGR
jgi:hypothetical protein